MKAAASIAAPRPELPGLRADPRYSWFVRRTLLVLCVVACQGTRPARKLDPDLVRVSQDARLRTDVVGGAKLAYPIGAGASPEVRDYLDELDTGHKFAGEATFVLVDAENTGTEGAHITLGGELHDAAGGTVGSLKPESLWVPAGEQRTFALVDAERQPRPTASAARLVVRGATIPLEPPLPRIEDVVTYDDYGTVVIQGTLVNPAERRGQIMVFASFHDAGGRPMTRPFSFVPVEAASRTPIQFVGPQDSKKGVLFVGESVY
jgi:hypothetical protein